MLTAHADIDVTAAEPAIAFYCDGLGLSVKRRLSRTWIELEGANLPIFLLAERPPYADLGSRQVPRSFERHWTPVHLDFIVADLDAAVARLVALGGSLDRAYPTPGSRRRWTGGGKAAFARPMSPIPAEMALYAGGRGARARHRGAHRCPQCLPASSKTRVPSAWCSASSSSTR